MARILHVSVTAGQDPTGAIALDLASHAADAGHEVAIAYGRRRAPNVSLVTCRRIASPIDWAIHGVATRLGDAHGRLSSPSSAKLRHLVRQFSPDIIHLHNLHGYYISLADLCSIIRQCNIPTLLTLHDLWPLTGHCANPESCRLMYNGCAAQCPHRHEYPKSLVSRSASNFRARIDALNSIPQLHLVCPSNSLIQIVNKTTVLRQPVHLIHNGIDTDRFIPSSITKAPVVLAVARDWSKQKGLAELLELRQYLPAGIGIIAVGRFPAKTVSHSGISFVGTLAPDRLIELYQRAAVVAVTSHGESFSLVKAEALSCGTPVVSFQAIAAGDLLYKPYGAAIPNYDSALMARAICEIMQHPTATNIIRQHALQYYSRQTMLNKYMHLYQYLLK